MKLIPFKNALEDSKNKEKFLLLGNGFSLAWDNEKFHYKNLLEQTQSTWNQDSTIKSIFDNLETYDFEKVINMLENAERIVRLYDNNSYIISKKGSR